MCGYRDGCIAAGAIDEINGRLQGIEERLEGVEGRLGCDTYCRCTDLEELGDGMLRTRTALRVSLFVVLTMIIALISFGGGAITKHRAVLHDITDQQKAIEHKVDRLETSVKEARHEGDSVLGHSR